MSKTFGQLRALIKRAGFSLYLFALLMLVAASVVAVSGVVWAVVSFYAR